MLISSTKNCIVSLKIKDRGVYVEELGGYLTSLNEDIRLAKEFIRNEKVFSTYASALETVTDQYQPAGTDYIIHVLGDNNREKYLNSFYNENFKYVTTINETYTEYEYWIKNSNWFFYRELYKMYIPTYTNTYQTFWKKSEDKPEIYSNNIDTEIIVNSLNTTTIKVKTDSNINGIADLKINYCVDKDESLASKLILNKMVYASNINETLLHENYYSNWFMKSEGNEYIPVTIINGEGEVVLTSMPERGTKLNISSAECKNVYMTYFEYLPAMQKVEVDGNNIILRVENNAKNRYILDNAKSINIENNNIEINRIEVLDENINIILNYNNVDEINEYLRSNNVYKINK